MWVLKSLYEKVVGAPAAEKVPEETATAELERGINPMCPRCQGEFRDPDPGWFNWANPIQKRLECRICGVSTYVSKALYRIWLAGPSHIPHMT